MGCFPVDFQEAKRPLRTKSAKRPIKVGKRPINEGKRPIKAMVLVGISVGCLMLCFRAPRPWWKRAPLKRPIKRSMSKTLSCLFVWGIAQLSRDMLQNGVSHRCAFVKLSAKGGMCPMSHHFGGVLISLKKYRAIWGIAAIVSQYRAIWGH